MAKSIKLGSDTYLDASGVVIDSKGTTLDTALGARYSAQDSTEYTLSNTGVNYLRELEVPAGTYVVSGNVYFPSNANGTYRNASLRYKSASASTWTLLAATQFPPVSGATTRGNVCATISFSSARTVALTAEQNSGSTMTVTCILSITRIR